MKQQSWSRTGKNNFSIRQKQINKPAYIESKLYGNISDIKEESNQLFVRVIFDIANYNEQLSNNWFKLSISIREFIEDYGSLESFSTRLGFVKCFLTYKEPSVKSGVVSINNEYYNEISQSYTTSNTSLSEVIGSFSSEESTFYKIKKVSYKPSNKTAIKISENKLSFNTEGNYLEINDKLTTFGGPINFQSLPNEHLWGGMFKMQNPILGLIPSTIVTPIPMYTLNLPIEQIKKAIELLSIASSLLE